MKVEAVFDLGGVRVAQLFVDRFLTGERLIIGAPERDVVMGARAESPASRRTIGFLKKRYSFIRASGSRFEAMILAIRTGLPETQCIDEEAFGFRHLADGQYRAVKPAYRFAETNLRGGPAFPPIIGVLDDFEFQAGGMRETDERLSKPLGDGLLLELVPLQMILPERQRTFGYRERRGLHLTGSPAALQPAVRKGGHHGPGFDFSVRIIQVVNRNLAVHQNSLLGHAQADGLRKEFDVFLSAARAGGDVMIAGEWVIHFVPLGYCLKHVNQKTTFSASCTRRLGG